MELQFNLIFVIIVGIIIFSFFLFFTFKYIDLQKEKESVEIARAMDNIILGLKSTTQHKELDVNFDFSFDVDCDNIIINDGAYGQKVSSIFFASPGRGKDLLFWSKDLKKPFRIDTLLFIVDNSKKYYSNRPGFFKDFINQGSSTNFDVGVFFDGECPSGTQKIICVDSDWIFFGEDSFPLIDENLVYGAAFSDKEQFNCSFNKILIKWNNLIEIYLNKNEQSSDCSSIRQDVETELNIIKASLLSNNFEFDVGGLETANRRLRDYNCEVLF